MFFAFMIDNGLAKIKINDLSSVKEWEGTQNLDDFLSENYTSCLERLSEYKLLRECDSDDYGHYITYAISKSLKEFLFDGSFPYSNEIQEVINQHKFKFPF